MRFDPVNDMLRAGLRGLIWLGVKSEGREETR